MDLHPCVCGESRFPREPEKTLLPDGLAEVRFAGPCDNCGRPREFVYRMSTEPEIEEPGWPRFGGPEPSELIDADQWVAAAARYAAPPADPMRMRTAMACINEAEKLGAEGLSPLWESYNRSSGVWEPRPWPGPPSYEKDPATGFPTDTGRTALSGYNRLPYQIRARFQDDPAERDRRLAAVAAVRSAWCVRQGYPEWDEDADEYDMPADRLPPAEPAWELVRAARAAAGQDPATGEFVR